MRAVAPLGVRNPSSARANSVTLNLPKDPSLIAAARLTAAGVAFRAGLSFDTIEDLKIIVAEACTYCMTRGGPMPSGRLRITFELYPNSFVVLVADPEFRFVSWQRTRSSTVAGTADELFIIRGLADELEYRASPASGLVLRITKSI